MVPKKAAALQSPSPDSLEEVFSDAGPLRGGLADVGRLAALRRCRLLDTEPEEAFDRVTRLAARLLRAPIALVTLVEPHRQFFKSAVGLSEPEASQRETLLSRSFCQHVVVREAPLVVEDARAHPLVKDSAAVPDVLAYLGVPLRAPTGEVLGSLCVFGPEPRAWSTEDERALEDLAAVLTDEIELRQTAREREVEARAHAAIRALTDASFDAIADIFFLLDRDDRLLRWNGRLSEVTGRTDAELAGMHALTVFSEQDRPAVAEAVVRAYAQGRAVVEADLLTAGGRVPYEFNGTPLTDGDGRVIGLCGTARDLSERKASEKALRESERTLGEANALFEGVAASVPGLIYQALVTPDGAVSFPYLSGVGAGCPENDVFRRARAHPERLLDLVHPDDQEGLRASLAEAARAPERWRPPESWSWEGRVVLNEGDVRWVSVGARPVTDEAGRVLWNGVVLDVTDRCEAQQAAGVAARRTQEILASISDAFCVLDRDWNFNYVNAQAERLWGRPAAELLGRSGWEMFPEVVDSAFGEASRRAAETGEPSSVTAYYAPLEKHFAVRIYPFADGLSVYFRDVTAKLKREAAVRESEARFRQTAEAMPQLVWTTTPEGYHDYFNERWYAFTGMPRPGEPGGEKEVPQGFNWKDYLHPDDSERTIARWEHSLSTGEPYEIEYRFRRASDGAYRWFIARAMPVRSEAGETVRWFGTCTDIHDLLEAEAALRESEERLRLVSQATDDVVWDWNIVTGTVEWNPAMGARYGWHELMNATPIQWWAERVHPEDRERALHSLNAHVDEGGGSGWQHEYRFERADGGWADVLDRGHVVRNEDGEPVRMVGSMLDLTAQKEVERALVKAKEQAEAAARAKGTLLSNMSHEIRTPLTSVIGFAEVLADEVAEEHQEFVQFIAQSGHRLLETLNSVLDLAEIEAGRHQMHLAEVDAREVVTGAANLFRSKAEAKGLSFDVALSETPVCLRTDAAALGRVLTNLVSNAVKFTAAGGITVSMMADAEGAEVRVTDTGVGIADAFLPRLYDEFYQESEGETRDFEGSGLGLAITRRLVEALGGTIAVKSGKGEGSTFSVRLPAAGPVSAET